MSFTKWKKAVNSAKVRLMCCLCLPLNKVPSETGDPQQAPSHSRRCALHVIHGNTSLHRGLSLCTDVCKPPWCVEQTRRGPGALMRMQPWLQRDSSAPDFGSGSLLAGPPKGPWTRVMPIISHADCCELWKSWGLAVRDSPEKALVQQRLFNMHPSQQHMPQSLCFFSTNSFYTLHMGGL